MTERLLTVSADDDGQRLDRWLKRHVPDMPYGLAQKLLRKGAIKVNGKKAKTDLRLEGGAEIRIPPFETGGIKREKREQKVSDKDAAFIKSLVIYEDQDVIALNKPGGLAVQGGSKTKRHIDGMLGALSNKEGVKPRLVHRLDKDTSGVLLLARSAKAAKELGRLFKERQVKKIYWAIISPTPEVKDGTIKAPLTKSGENYEKMSIDDEGKYAVTEYSVLEHAGKKAAFAVFWPRTGRTHQIRIHAADILKAPVFGDGKYGGIRNEEGEKRIDGLENLSKELHLHAARLILPHPFKKGKIDVAAPLPPNLAKSWKSLGFSPKIKQDPFADL